MLERWTSLSPSWRWCSDCAGPVRHPLPDVPRTSVRRRWCSNDYDDTMVAIHGEAARASKRPARPSMAGRSAAREPVARKRATSPQHAVGGNTRRRPVLELHAERKATLGEDFLDLGERLLAQVRGLEQLDLGLLDQVADVVDALGLQAVGRTHRQLEVVDRTQQD